MTVELGMIWKIRKGVFEDRNSPSKIRPGPWMLTFLLTTSSSEVRLMFLPLSAGSKLIVLPSLASASAWRNEPGPLSLVFVTVVVAA